MSEHGDELAAAELAAEADRLDELLQGLTPAQHEAVLHLRRVLAEFAVALHECGENGLKPVDAFRRCGIEVPLWAGPMVNALIPH